MPLGIRVPSGIYPHQLNTQLMKNIFTIRDKDESVKRSRGDVGSDGLIFWSYFKDAGRRKGEIMERWLSPADFQLRREKAMAASGKAYQKVKVENPEKIKNQFRSFRERNKDREILRCREWRKNNPKKQREACVKWNKDNKDACRIHRQRANRKAASLGTLSYFKKRIRSRVNHAIRAKGCKKSSSTRDMIGCDWATLRSYIESKFLPGMSWENKGLWEIDHIIPLASAKTEEDVVRLCNWKNLQPLWQWDNRSKGDKMPDDS